MTPTSPPPPRVITDINALKALAHPLRQRIRQLLGRGPANSTTLARELGESTASTSYHLRQLASYGFIEEVPERSRGRERWWRSVRTDLRYQPPDQQSPEYRAVLGEMRRLQFAADLEAFARFQLQRDQMGEWGDAAPYARGAVRVTRDELHALFEEYISMLKRYQRPVEESPPGAQTVLTRFLAFPAPEPTGAPEDGHPADERTG